MIRPLVLALALIFGSVSMAEAATNIAIAPLMQVAKKSKLNEAQEKFLESKFGKEKEKLEKEIKAFQKKVEEFQKQASALSDSARQQKAQELDKENRTIASKQQEFSQKAAPVVQKMNEEIEKILGEACANYAKANGYDIILDAATVLYVTSAANVEEGLVEEVNKIWKEKGSKFKF